jgi:hypothetical protein
MRVNRSDYIGTGEKATAILITTPDVANPTFATRSGSLNAKQLLHKSKYAHSRTPSLEVKLAKGEDEVAVLVSYEENVDAHFTINFHCDVPFKVDAILPTGNSITVSHKTNADTTGGGPVQPGALAHANQQHHGQPQQQPPIRGGGGGGTTPRPSAAAVVPVVQQHAQSLSTAGEWSFSDSKGWVAYSSNLSKILEKAHRLHDTQFELDVAGNGSKYQIDLRAMHQVSPRGYVRDIRRVEKRAGAGGGGGGGGDPLVEMLCEMFPNLSVADASKALKQSKGDIEQALESLLT